MTPQVTWHDHKIPKSLRQSRNRHPSFVLWFTGLSGSGKSTLANALDESLFELGMHTYILDGDNIRHGINRDLGFSEEDRTENIRRISEIAKLFVDAGIVVLSAFISPFSKDRLFARNLFEKGEFIEIFVQCPIEICEKRDSKGLYQKARQGLIPEFTGISSPYEAPVQAEIEIPNHDLSIRESVQKILDYLKSQNRLIAKT